MSTSRVANASHFPAGLRWLVASLLVTFCLPGCAAFHPIRGVPAPYVPPEYLGPSRSGKKTIDLSLLVQTPPDEYRVAARDTLSIYIPGVLGSLNVEEDRQIGETPPINLSSNPNDPPTIGYPITVRDDGTIALPYVDPINVNGMTIPEIEVAVRRAYTEHSNVLNGERDRVLVSLQRRREVSVIVVRQETSSELTQGAQAGTLNVGNSKRGTARTVRLPAYENDVLHALANSQIGSDGLPGLDAKNTIYIIRRKRQATSDAASVTRPAGPVTFPETHGSTSVAPWQPMPTPSASPLPSAAPPAEWPGQASRAAPAAQQPSPIAPPATLPPQRPPTMPASPIPQRDSGAQITRPEPIEARPQPPAPRTAPPEHSPVTPTPPRPSETDAPHSTTPQPWPAPAQPSTTIQRTSGQAGETPARAAWPTIRGQSPPGWSWGHSPAAHASSGLLPAGPVSGPGSVMPQSPFGHDVSPVASRASGGLPGAYSFGGGYPTAGRGESYSVRPGPAEVHEWGVVPHGGLPHGGLPYGAPVGAMPFPADFAGHDLSAYSGHGNAWQSALAGFDPTVDNPNVVKIPIRLADGERPTFTERDIILEDGDIVFIESRETEVFYTGGLLGGGQYTLPRDYDLRVLEAISIAQSPQNNSQGSGRAIGGSSALNQDVTISASHVVILRSLPNGTRIPIEIDLYKAVRRPEENLLVQPGDMLILQYTKIEAIAAFIERNLLEGAIFGIAAAQLNQPGGGGN